jgi:integrase/recombinase XerD
MNLEIVSVERTRSRQPIKGPHAGNRAEPPRPVCSPESELRRSQLAQLAIPALIDRYVGRLAQDDLSGLEHVKAYLLDLYRRNCRPNTIHSRFGAILLFLRFLKNRCDKHLQAATRQDLSCFIEHEQDRGLMPRSVDNCLKALGAFFSFLVECEILHPDVLKRKIRIKIPDALPRAIDPQDIQQLLAVVKTPRDRAMVLVLLRTGMRIGELLDTRLSDLNLREKRVEIFEAQKNRSGRVVYISEDAHLALTKWLKLRKADSLYLFHGPGGRPLSYEAARVRFKKYLAKAGLAHRGYTLHCLRHTYASELLNAGMRLECLQQLLGHSSIEQTRRYARLTDNTRKEEYFRAMAIIERGEINGHYRLNPELS